jgi:hypothetical protein
LPSIVRWDTTKCHYWKGIPWSVQEVQLLCVGSSGSFSTEQEFHRVRNGNQESLYPQAHQSLDSTALPAHRLKLNETKVAVGNQGNCKFYCIPLSSIAPCTVWVCLFTKLLAYPWCSRCL